MAPLSDDAGRKLVSCREAAEVYGCSMRYIRKLVADGRLHYLEIAGTYMVDLAQVQQLATRKEGGRQRKRAEGFNPG